MSWDRDSLWAKSCVFMERGFQESKNEPLFGLWVAFGLELLVRSAIANVSPTLLAEPEKNHSHLLHALGRGSKDCQKKSIGFAQVLQLCSTLFDKFSAEEHKTASAIINRRNEELHTGTCAFEEYPSSKWLLGFYRVCKVLCECQGKELKELFGTEEAEKAESLLKEQTQEIRGTVKAKIAAHRKVFEGKSEEKRKQATEEAEISATELSFHGHHKIRCPACKSLASIKGETYGQEQVSHEDGEVIVRKPVIPREFYCSACELKLVGYAELEATEIGGRYTRTSTYSPEEYFGLIDPASPEPGSEYDNE